MRLRRLRTRPAAGTAAQPVSPEAAAMPKKKRSSYSLFGEILDWMLAPLLFLWPISIIATYDVASHIANQPYDRALSDQVMAISKQIRMTASGQVRIDFPVSATRLLRTDAEDTIYFQVISPTGELLVGDPEVPRLPQGTHLASKEIQFRDADIQGEDIRVAYMPVITDPAHPDAFALIQVAETRHKRNSLSARIVSGVLLPQFAIIPLAVVLVWFGLSRGIAPLNRLQGLIRERRSGDLSPVATDSVPEEVRPVVIAFNDMMARLEDNLQAQQRFIADAAHQMRTPIAGLKMHAELALQEAAQANDPLQLQRSIAHMHAGVERAARLINQLLALARAEASSEKVHAFTRIDLNELVREVLGDYVPLALSKGIDIGAEDADVEIWLDATPILMFELVSNLVDNAVKYTPHGGRVTVRVARDPGDTHRILLTVQDSGPGIAPEDRERVFERFYRVLGSAAEGSGLGLSIVREVAELHGGDVVLRGGDGGVGTCVSVSLPLASDVATQ
ncbi:MAG TPA: sensor histidine kinase N-terminal domain-containing protein [Rhodocyclaceae bacterium]|nr:sensor histidine kinase N-terminal domain-containing protein [Rhodocyclaceae bacterium]